MIPFGEPWRATVEHDGQGLQHRPLARQRVPTSRYTYEQLAELVEEADELTGRLRHRCSRSDTLDRRLLRICGQAEARYLRRLWLRRTPYVWEAVV